MQAIKKCALVMSVALGVCLYICPMEDNDNDGGYRGYPDSDLVYDNYSGACHRSSVYTGYVNDPNLTFLQKKLCQAIDNRHPGQMVQLLRLGIQIPDSYPNKHCDFWLPQLLCDEALNNRFDRVKELLSHGIKVPDSPANRWGTSRLSCLYQLVKNKQFKMLNALIPHASDKELAHKNPLKNFHECVSDYRTVFEALLDVAAPSERNDFAVKYDELDEESKYFYHASFRALGKRCNTFTQNDNDIFTLFLDAPADALCSHIQKHTPYWFHFTDNFLAAVHKGAYTIPYFFGRACMILEANKDECHTIGLTSNNYDEPPKNENSKMKRMVEKLLPADPVFMFSALDDEGACGVVKKLLESEDGYSPHTYYPIRAYLAQQVMTIKNRSHDPYELDHALDKQNNPIECLMHSGWHDVRSDCTSCDEQPRVVDTFERDGGTTRGKPTAQEKNKHYAQCYQKTKEKEDNAWYAFEPQCFCKERKVLRVGHKMPVIPEAFPDVDNWHKDDCPETAYERARRCGNTRMLKVFDDHEYKNLEALRQKVARGERLKKELAQARQKKRELATQKMYEWQTVRSRRSRKNTNIHNTDTHELQI